MTDNLAPVPSDPPMVTTPLLTDAGFSVCGKFSSDLADLCNAASLAGMTPNMICGQLWNMTMLVGFQIKEQADAATAAATPSAAPPPTPPAPPPPTPIEPPVQSGPVASGPSDPGMGSQPPVIAEPPSIPAPPIPPVTAPAPPAPDGTPLPTDVDSAGQTYAQWLESVAAAKVVAAAMGVTYTQGPTPTFAPPPKP